MPADEVPRRQRATNRALDVEEGRRLRSSSQRVLVPKRDRLEAERAYHFGLKHLYATRFAQALPQLELAARSAPDVLEYALAYRFCSFRLAEQGDGLLDLRDRLIDLAERTRAQDPTLPLTPYVLGHLYMMIGDDERALREFRTAAERAPDNRDAERCVRVLDKRMGR